MFQPNPGKNLIIKINGVSYARYPVKTILIMPDETQNNADENAEKRRKNFDYPTQKILEIIKKYAMPHIQKGDILFISEKIIAVTQRRAYKISEIKPYFLAKILSRFVTKNPAGIGLSMPETMQLAIEECGLPRIIFAAFAAFLTKIFGIKGVFYRIAGKQASAIDGPVPYAIPPYNEYATKGPKNSKAIAEYLSRELEVGIAIVDANDLGVEVLGASRGVDKDLIRKTLKDNPLGQSDEQTPIGILRVHR